MVKQRHGHSLVAIKSKLFVVDTGNNLTTEVFDKFTKKFVVIPNATFSKSNNVFFVGATSIGNKIAVFGSYSKTIILYDTDKNEWIEEPCGIATYPYNACCIKIT